MVRRQTHSASDRRRRWPVAVVLLVALVALLVPASGSGAVGPRVGQQVELLQTPDVPVEQREPVVAPDPNHGVSSSEITKQLPDLSGDPAEVLARLSRDAKSSTVSSDLYQVDGSDHVAAAYSGPMNYQTAEGMVPIDPSLVRTDAGFGLTAAPFGLRFPDKWTADTPVVMSGDGWSYSFSLMGMDATVAKQSDATSLVYEDALPGVDSRFATLRTGMEESLVLASADAAKQPLTYRVETVGVTLKLTEDGSLDLVDQSGDVVAVVPAPMAIDASGVVGTGEPDATGVSYQLDQQGDGAYQVSVVLDSKLVETAKYPLVVDPPPHIEIDGDTSPSDGWTDLMDPNATGVAVNNQIDTLLRIGNSSSSDGPRYGFINFPVASLQRDNRIVFDAWAEFWPYTVNDSSQNIWVKAVTTAWPQPPTKLKWNNQPDVGGTSWGPEHGAAGSGWYVFDVTDRYQTVLDSLNGVSNHGLRLHADAGASPISSNYHEFYSSDSTAGPPVLLIDYDDPPSRPSLDSPDNGETVFNLSPTLEVTGKSTDNQANDDIWVRYCWTTSSSDDPCTHSNSGWLTNGSSYTIPAGVLDDGQTYYWAAQTRDQWMTSGYLESGTKHFTVSLPRLGEDDQWPMLDEKLGNGVDAQVNESNGNLYVSMRLFEMKTPGGPLDVELAYNSQDASDFGLGRGWVISAGPSFDPHKLPVQAAEKNDAKTLQVKLQDGSVTAFGRVTKNGDNTYAVYRATGRAAASLVMHTPEGDKTQDSLVYETASGSRYWFEKRTPTCSTACIWLPTKATTRSASGSQNLFTYVFNSSGMISSITEPAGRKVVFGYDTGTSTHLQTVTVRDYGASIPAQVGGVDQVWQTSYDTAKSTTGELSGVTDPMGRVVAFEYGYDPNGGSCPSSSLTCYLTSVTNGSGDAWAIGYANAPSGADDAPEPYVASIADPGHGTNSSGHPIERTFTWSSSGSEYVGQTAPEVDVVDPRGYLDSNTASDYQTTLEMDTAGHAIREYAPPESVDGTSVRPLTVRLWNTDGQPLCARGATANQESLDGSGQPTKCISSGGGGLRDALNTDYFYAEPHTGAMSEIQLPAPNPDGTGTRPETDYTYDQGLTGLAQENYTSSAMNGVPVYQSVDTGTPATVNWGTGAPNSVSNVNGFAVRWSGWIHVTTPSWYKFRVYHDDGLRIQVGSVMLEDCWQRNSTSQVYTAHYNCGSDTDDKIYLASDAQITVEYHDVSGAAGINLQWDQGSGSWTTMANTRFDPGLTLLTSTVDPRGMTTAYQYNDNQREARSLYDTITKTKRSGATGTSADESYTYDAYGRVKTDTIGTTTTTNTYADASGSHTACLAQSIATTPSDTTGTTTAYTCDVLGNVLTTTETVRSVSGTKQTSTQSRETDTGYNGDSQVISQTTPGTTQPTTTSYYADGELKATTDPLGRTTSYAYAYSADGRRMTKTLPSPGPVLRATNTATATSGSSSYQVVVPQNLQAGDLILVELGARGNTTWTPPSGWTLVASDHDATTITDTVYQRVATGNEAGTTVTFTANTTNGGTITTQVWSGADQATPLDTTASSQNSAGTGSGSITAPSVTTATTGAVVVFSASKSQLGGFTPAGGYSELYDFQQTTGSQTMTSVSGWQILPNPGATGSVTFTTGTSGKWAAHLIALRPTPAPVELTDYDQVGNLVATSHTTTTDSDCSSGCPTWTSSWDAQNRVTSTTTPGVGTATTYTYDQDAADYSGTNDFLTATVTKPIDSSSTVSETTTRDMLGRIAFDQQFSQMVGMPRPTTYTYDQYGDLAKVTRPMGDPSDETTGHYTKYAYDGFGRQTSITRRSDYSGASPTDASQTTTYDDLGRVTQTTDEDGNATNYGYADPRTDSPTAISQAAASCGGSCTGGCQTTECTRIVYDDAGERLQVTDPDGRVRDWAYAVNGRPSDAYNYPNGTSLNPTGGTASHWAYTYDQAGRLAYTEDPRSIRVCASLDQDDHQIARYAVPTATGCTSANAAQSDLDTYTYRPWAGMTNAHDQDSGATTTITPDTANPERPSTVSQAGETTTYTYQPDSGLVTQIQDVQGATTSTTGYQYNAYTGLLWTITDPLTGNPQTVYTYNDDGAIATRTDPSGTGQLTNTYDKADRLTQRTYTNTSTSTQLASFAYTFDKADLVTGLSQTFPNVGSTANADNGSWAYHYYADAKLKDARFTPTGSSARPIQTYCYDGAGNRTSLVSGTSTCPGAPQTTYNYAGQITSVNGTTYTNDAIGQLCAIGAITCTGGTPTRRYAYDTWGRQTSALASTTTITNTYDALDRTTSRNDGTTTTNYTYTGTTGAITMATTGSTTTQYAYGPDARLGQKDASGTRVFLTDLHGNEALIVNNNTTAKGTLAYDPWGSKSSTIGTDATNTPFGYQADITDPTTGLIDMGARNYDPTQGRFTTQDTLFGDTLDPNTLNQYAYAEDSPLAYADPDGHMPLGCGQNFGCGDPNHPGQNIGGVPTGTSGAPPTDTDINTPGSAGAPQPTNHPLPPGWYKPATRPWGAVNWQPGYFCHGGIRGLTACYPQPHPPSLSWQDAAFVAGLPLLPLAFAAAPELLGVGGGAELTVDTVSVESGVGSDIAPMTVVRSITKGEKIVDLLDEVKGLTYETGNEHAIVRLTGQGRALVSGGADGIELPSSVTRVIAHTHPYDVVDLGASSADLGMLDALGQKSSWLVIRGIIVKFPES